MRCVWAWIRLIGLFLKEFVFSVKNVAVAVLAPWRPLRSSIVAVPLDLKSNEGITLLASMSTLTPGTTVIYINDDRTALYAHVMNASEQCVIDMKKGFEGSVKEVLK
jgi:multicomponent Na+:H+ antiporter subunit E